MTINGFLDFTYITEDGDHTEEQWIQLMDEMTSDHRPMIQIHENIYDRFLEISPSVYLNSGGFGFVEGADYVIDF